MDKVFWNKKDLCQQTGQSLSTINRWMRNGTISFIKIGDEDGRGAVLFNPSTVIDEILSHTVKNEKEDENSASDELQEAA